MARPPKRDDASRTQAYYEAIASTSRLRRDPQSGKWYIHYSYPDPNAQGTVARWRGDKTSTRTLDDQEALDALAEWKQKAREQIRQVKATQPKTISEIAQAYLEVCPDAASQVYSLASITEALGSLTPADINDAVLRDYKQVRRNKRTGELMNPASFRRELSALRSALRYGMDQKLFSADDMPKIVTGPAGPPRVKFLEEEKEVWFWNEAQKAPYPVGLFVALGLDTAARRGAICDVTWDRVDLKQRLIDYRVPGMRESRKRRAVVSINDRLLPILQAAKVASGGVGRVMPHYPRKTYSTWTRSIGMGWVTPHVMRHTWASLAAIRGESLLHIAKMLGDTYKTVEDTYAHLQPTHLHEIANRRFAKVA